MDMEIQKRQQFCLNYGREECVKYLYAPRYKYSCAGCEFRDFVLDLDCGECRYLFCEHGTTVCLKNHNICGDESQRSAQCLRFGWKEPRK